MGSMTSENTWRINLDQGQEIREFATQYSSFSTVSKGSPVLPSVFGQDGDLFYKFMDTNMFAMIAANKQDPSTMTIYLINGVTGRIAHQFKESDVSKNSQHSICQIFSEQFYILSF